MNVHQTIIKGIKEQLFFNNYLVIPNFGGFVLKKIPSHFSPSGGTISPPFKSVSFNSQLKQNDGILAHWLQSNINCSQSEALAHLEDFAAYCKSILGLKGRLSVDGLGFFYSDLEGNICFEPHQQVNFLRSSFGLSTVAAKELEPELVKEKVKENIFVDRLPEITELKQQSASRRNYRKVAYAAVSGLLLFSSVLLFVSNKNLRGKMQAAFGGKEIKSTYSPVNYLQLDLAKTSNEKKEYVADAGGIAILELDGSKNIPVQAVELTEPVVSTQAHSQKVITRSQKNYEIVLGCFGVLDNAHKMIKKLKAESINCALLAQKHKGLFVVSGGSFDSQEQAVTQLSSIKAQFPNAWLKKPE